MFSFRTAKDDSLLVYWPLNEGGASYAVDYSLNPSTLNLLTYSSTLNGIWMYVDEKFGNLAMFNQTTASKYDNSPLPGISMTRIAKSLTPFKISFPDVISTKNMTLEFWVFEMLIYFV